MVPRNTAVAGCSGTGTCTYRIKQDAEVGVENEEYEKEAIYLRHTTKNQTQVVTTHY